ncbi:OLC1v1019171C1 [Oldenlandia corymbosa var. corymbosa]|uniref:OLC1v1019171C1 n=1 Tax=Oldenlandia corymbosa var. corymbosa TaxID=529605 RepID=A0AAV1EDH1_OLDCO|nr:OLC1v1019171C1 [Oldenlandia corymbosa var. corymbosa]
MQLKAVARETTLLSYSFLPEKEKFEKVKDSLPRLLNKVKIIKAKLRNISEEFSQSIFPKTSVLQFFDFLVRNIKDVVKHDPESITQVKHHFEEVLLYLESLKSFLVTKLKDPVGAFDDLRNHIVDLAYKLEYVVETIEIDGHFQQSIWLYDLLENIRNVDQLVQEIHKMSSPVKVENLPRISSRVLSRNTTIETSEMLVDLVDQENL